MKTICTVAAVIVDRDQRTLLVRKKGSDTFIQPGGKPDDGEEPVAALARELREELGVELVPASVVSLGTFEAPAVNEPGCLVRAEAFLAEVTGSIASQAEIEECVWVPLRGPFAVKVAPLSAQHVLPAAASRFAAVPG